MDNPTNSHDADFYHASHGTPAYSWVEVGVGATEYRSHGVGPLSVTCGHATSCQKEPISVESSRR